MSKRHFLFLTLWFCVWQATAQKPSGFVSVEQNHFVLNNKPYKYIGTNLWYGMYLGSAGKLGDRARLIEELDHLQRLGLTNLRIMAASEGMDGIYQNSPSLQTAPGVYDEDLLSGLDFLLSEMGKRNMKAVVCLGNFWMWSGGFSQYISWTDQSGIPYPDIENGGPWNPFIDYTKGFYTNLKAMQWYFDHIAFIINRTNSITQKKYKDDPAIMAWQLSNEPRGYDQVKAYRRWIKKSARFIKSLDKNHLVSIGSEGNASNLAAGLDLYKDNKNRYIDYCTTHIWIQNWGWYDPLRVETYDKAVSRTKKYIASQVESAKRLKKPLVIEEFGVSRDNAQFKSSASANYRDKYYDLIFGIVSEDIRKEGLIQGCNFWSWGGLARPTHPGQMWQSGDALIGDPAHELQGWYSIYSTDQSTLAIIERYTVRLQKETEKLSSDD